MPNNKPHAVDRLQSLNRRLDKDPALRDKYSHGIETLGYAEKVPDDELDRHDNAVRYLPHHPVFHARKPEKLRIVFDCAANYHGKLLNDYVHKGPDLVCLFVCLLEFNVSLSQ